MFGPEYTLFEHLSGRWTIERSVDDKLAKLEGRFAGAASLLPTPEPGVLHYHESGTLSFGPFEHAAERSYRWHCIAPDRARVYFHDGRYFHSLILRGTIAEVDHPCGRDSYRGRYLFESRDIWRLSWQVKGPRKDYTMQSTFTRRC